MQADEIDNFMENHNFTRYHVSTRTGKAYFKPKGIQSHSIRFSHDGVDTFKFQLKDSGEWKTEEWVDDSDKKGLKSILAEIGEGYYEVT